MKIRMTLVMLIGAILVLSISPIYGRRLGANINAICKIELNDGTLVEGVILAAYEAGCPYLNTNGFYMEFESGGARALLFSPDFYAIRPYEAIIEDAPNMRGKINQKVKNVYFLYDISRTPRSARPDAYEHNIEIDSLETRMILRNDILFHNEYELLDEISIYPFVPEELNLRYVESISPIKIQVKMIKRIEFILEPSEKWLDQISKAEEKYLEKNKTSRCPHPAPAWFHEIYDKDIEINKWFKPFYIREF